MKCSYTKRYNSCLRPYSALKMKLVLKNIFFVTKFAVRCNTVIENPHSLVLHYIKGLYLF